MIIYTHTHIYIGLDSQSAPQIGVTHVQQEMG